MIRDISDPEHPLSLEQLNIVQVCCAVVPPSCCGVVVRSTVCPLICFSSAKDVCIDRSLLFFGSVTLAPPQLSKIWVDDANSRVAVEFVPTIPHCRSFPSVPWFHYHIPNRHLFFACNCTAAPAPSSASPSASSCRQRRPTKSKKKRTFSQP